MSVTGYSNQRREIEAHAEVLQVHQTVLQKHAELHQVQANAREALRADVRPLAEMALARADDVDVRLRALQLEIWGAETKILMLHSVLSRPFFGRLRWLLTGK